MGRPPTRHQVVILACQTELELRNKQSQRVKDAIISDTKETVSADDIEATFYPCTLFCIVLILVLFFLFSVGGDYYIA